MFQVGLSATDKQAYRQYCGTQGEVSVTLEMLWTLSRILLPSMLLEAYSKRKRFSLRGTNTFLSKWDSCSKRLYLKESKKKKKFTSFLHYRNGEKLPYVSVTVTVIVDSALVSHWQRQIKDPLTILSILKYNM